MSLDSGSWQNTACAYDVDDSFSCSPKNDVTDLASVPSPQPLSGEVTLQLNLRGRFYAKTLNTGGIRTFPARFAGEIDVVVNGSCTGRDCGPAAVGGGVVGGFPCVTTFASGVRNLDDLN